MADNFAGSQPGLTTPAEDGAAVTPSDSTVLPTTRALYVGGTGNLAVVMKSGTTLTFNSVPAGSMLSLRVTKVKSTGTTATNIVALW